MAKLLMISSHFIDHGGGLERVADDLARRLGDDGRFEVTLAAHGPAPADPGYRTLALRASSMVERVTGLPLLIPHPGDIRALAKEVQQSDVIVLHDNLYLANIISQWIAQRQLIPTILIKHSGWVHSPSSLVRAAQSLANRLVLGPSLRSATRCVAVTVAKRESLLNLARGRSLEVIENGIDTSLFSIRDVQRDVDVIFIGRFVAKKGIELIERLAVLMPDCTFLCAGFGPAMPDRRYSNITIVEQPHPSEIALLYARGRVAIVPVHSEGTPLVVAESLACGTPVIASNQAAHPQLPLEAVLPIDLEWPEEVVLQWKQAIRTALAKKGDPNDLREPVTRHFSLMTTARRYADLIEEVINASSDLSRQQAVKSKDSTDNAASSAS